MALAQLATFGKPTWSWDNGWPIAVAVFAFAKIWYTAIAWKVPWLKAWWEQKPHSVFVNSMGDLFHEEVPFAFILEVFAVMKQAYWHRFQLLTKRAQRLADLAPLLEWTPNIWMGVTVESNDYVGRIDFLRGTAARTKFLSMEPLLGPVPDLRLDGIDWVIVGGESGPGARLVEAAWVTQIRDKCLATDVPFFFKQWGGANRKKMGRRLEGRLWSEVPEFRGIAQPTLPL